MLFSTPRHPLCTASIDHLPSKSLKPQIVRVRRSKSLLANPHLDTPSTQRPALPKKEAATALGAYRVLRVYRMGCQQLLDYLETGRKGCSKTGPEARVATHVGRPSSALKRTQAQSVRGGLRSQRPRKVPTIDVGSVSSNSSNY
jgi:hypothetical protein